MTAVDKQKVAASFSKAAKHYDNFAFLQNEVGERLFERLSLMNIKPQRIADLGCGTGVFTRKLKKQYSKAQVTGVDIAEGMIEQAKKKNGLFSRCEYICADLDELPFADNSIDLLFSNLAIQWVPDLSATFRELNRVLKPQGLVLFSTLGPDTLKELRHAWQQVDSYTHVNDFIDMHDVGDAMLSAKLQDPVVDMEEIQLTYQTVTGLMKDLRGIGAHNMNEGSQRGLMGKSHWQAMVSHYEALRNEQGVLPATYEVIYGHGWRRPVALEQDTYSIEVK
ncbi:malonyl-ACP O-methyltransferase BioC [Pleionea sp. CnH1-48]|uniref:malonyl-ACP O-methyltransferase BioC n=1 Tax=Pleionea sp. CnH1-48 TaxID=2954494 RepID=UPI002098601A|nr:malonyl-ACP O-methyltransferase BioC [Pleionea sp. CnH1-48]MCO7225697.1 malonyl-ACP O-methyltransferase BioC [Pleionea sp. CnH1-48]